MSQFVSAVDDAGFEREVVQSDVPVVLDFWAEWCPPCRALAPTFEELAKQYAGRVRFLKLNVDENQQVPQRFGIKGIPTLVFFDGGREVERVVGASWFSSTLSLRKRTRPSYCFASSSKVGASARHGGHHSAQKSNTTGTSD